MIRVNLHNYQPTPAEWAIIRRINALNLGLTYDLGIWNLWGSDEQHDRVEGCLPACLDKCWVRGVIC